MGDVMIGRSVNKKISQEGYSYPWGNVLPYLRKPGVNIINLEAALTGSSRQVPKVFNFKADPNKVITLREAHIQAVNIANNHILDFDEEGLLETIRILDRAGIQHAGAGRTLAEARKPAVIKCNGLKIGLIGCTDNEPGWKSNGHPGVYYVGMQDTAELENDIKKLRKEVDFIILSAHVGPNMVESPDKEKIEFAHQLIDLGVDIIHGHSAHIFQGIELYNNGLIIYDWGDFMDFYGVER
jgi:poly-gamma-glutamate synthesis protein (capsule biosynthesis protein)